MTSGWFSTFVSHEGKNYGCLGIFNSPVIIIFIP